MQTGVQSGLLSTNMVDAMRLLLLAVTGACDETIVLGVGFMSESYFYSSVCLAATPAAYADKMLRLLNAYPMDHRRYEHHLLTAFAVMDEGPSHHFEQALQRNDAAVLHGLTLAKRLWRHGFSTTAMRIVDVAANTAATRDLNVLVRDRDELFSSGFLEHMGSAYGEGANDALAILAAARERMRHGSNFTFDEGPRYALEWHN